MEKIKSLKWSEQKLTSRFIVVELNSRSLLENMKGEKILLATPLLKWYLEHGLEVTKVHQVIEFTPEPCFKLFGDAVSDARRAGDADPSKAIIADTMKLVSLFEHRGNSGWGML